jgi:hypothetical protein
MPDIYDNEIQLLTNEPILIYDSWGFGDPLFRFIGSRGDTHQLDDNTYNDIHAGCLTQIRKNKYKGAFINGKYEEELTNEIRNDERIPTEGASITVEHLPVFAEWQRRIDILEQH